MEDRTVETSEPRQPEDEVDQVDSEGEEKDNHENRPEENQYSNHRDPEDQMAVFATPRSVSTGPPNPFSARSPPRVRDTDGNITLVPSRFGSNFKPNEESSRSSVAKPRLLLRPSLLSQVANGAGEPSAPAVTAFGSVPTMPSSASNPFLRGMNVDEPVANGTSDSEHSKTDGTANSFRTSTAPAETSSHPRVATSATSAAANSTFVFGQNIHERALVAEPAEKVESTESRLESASNGDSHPGLLFSSVAKDSTSQAAANVANAKTLNQSAQEYEAARTAKRRYDEVEVVTGEEEETNVLQVGCKLHIFDKGHWAERGRGHIRLNDKVIDNQMTSRAVMRCQGTLRILLNSKIWPGMTLERSSDRSIRMTGYDNGQIKVFLITASPKDADLIHSAMEYRLATVKALAQAQPDAGDSDGESGSKRRRESEEPPESAADL